MLESFQSGPWNSFFSETGKHRIISQDHQVSNNSPSSQYLPLCSLCRSMGGAGATRLPEAGGSPGAGRGQDGPHKAGHAQQTPPGHGPHVLHAGGGQGRGQVSARLGS